MVIFSINHKYLDVIPAEAGIYKKGNDNLIDPRVEHKDNIMEKIKAFLNKLALKYSEIKSIYLSLNDNRSDTSI